MDNKNWSGKLAEMGDLTKFSPEMENFRTLRDRYPDEFSGYYSKYKEKGWQSQGAWWHAISKLAKKHRTELAKLIEETA